MHADLTEVLLWRTLAIFLMIGSLLGAALGLMLIIKPKLLEPVSRVANRWISVQRLSQWLDRSISIERWFYRHHRPMGILIILGAGYILVHFGMLFDKTYAMQQLSASQSVTLPGLLLDAFVRMLLLGAALALMAGGIVCLRPSLLRGLEKAANRWVSSRNATRMLDVQRGDLDVFVVRHAQSAGWLLLLGSIYLFFAMFRFLT